jgi:hypothetical protein
MITTTTVSGKFRYFTNIDEKACNNIPEAVNKLAFSARLGHSCEINMTPFIILSKFQRFITG